MIGITDDWTPWRNNEFRVGKLLDTEILDLSAVDGTALRDVLDYWDRQRGGNFAPPLNRFRLDDLPPAIIPCMVIVDFVGDPVDHYYRFFGTRMVDISGMELTGKYYYADEIKGYGFANAKVFPEMIEERRPIVSRTKWISVKSTAYQTLTVRLPLSDDGQTVAHGITVNQFMRFEEID